MKVVILAGGFGTRISEYTKTIPKPMIKINNKSIPAIPSPKPVIISERPSGTLS